MWFVGNTEVGFIVNKARGLTIGDIQYPRNIFVLWSKEELAAIGIKPYREVRSDSRYYSDGALTRTEVDGEMVGQQYPSDTGPIDILAISKDKKEYLVIELKKGRASDNVVGQVQRYMGFIKDEYLEKDQKVRGAIIALENDLKFKRALSVTNDIDFYEYKINFDLVKS